MAFTKRKSSKLTYNDYETAFRKMWSIAKSNNKQGKLPQDKLAYGDAGYGPSLFNSAWFIIAFCATIASAIPVTLSEILDSNIDLFPLSVVILALGIGSFIVSFVKLPASVRNHREQQAIYARNYTWLAKKTKLSEREAQEMLSGYAVSLGEHSSCFVLIEDDKILFYTFHGRRVTVKLIELGDNFVIPASSEG